jgi:DNA-binding transcriptional LysR family regulator
MIVRFNIKDCDMPRNLDLTALRSFKTVAEVGGVTRAAAQLHLTQSAVSMQLKRLEESMGIALMDRSARQIALTPQGEILLSYARRLLSLNDEAWGRLTDSGYEGEINFGVPHDVIHPHIPHVLRRFAAEYPNVKVNLISSYTTSLKAGFEAGEIDVIMTTERGGPIDIEPLARQQLVWIGAVDGRAWKQRPIRISSHAACAFRPIAQEALDAANIPWEMAVDTDSSETVEATLLADLAIEGRLSGRVPAELEEIEHNGALPEMPMFNVHLYVCPDVQSVFAEHLAEMIRDVYK